MDEDFINQYVQRILREVDHINRDRLLKETKIIILESHSEVNKNEIENLKTQIAIADELKNQALSSLEKVTVDYKNLQENKNVFESTIRDLNNEKTNLNKELDNEKTRADNINKELRLLESTIRDLNNEKTNLKQELDNEKTRAANLDIEIRSFEKNAEKNLQENKNALESTIRDLKNELNNEKNRGANLDRELARQSGELNTMFLELQKLQENKNVFESTIRDLNNEKTNLKQELDNEKNRAANLDKELARQNDELNTMLLELQNSTQQVVDTTVTTRKNNRVPHKKGLPDNTF